VRPLRDEPERVERADRVLRPLRVEGVRPERPDGLEELVPVRPLPADPLAVAGDAPPAGASARPQTSQ
jgi:hypothetical protein